MASRELARATVGPGSSAGIVSGARVEVRVDARVAPPGLLVRSAVAVAVLAALAASGAGCRPYQSTLAGASALRSQAASSPRGGLATRDTFKLANGLTVVLEENHAAPVVALQAWMAVGAGDDPVGQEGIAHLFQHLLLMSTKTRPAGQAARELGSMGGRMAAWSSYDETVLRAVVASPFADAALALLADALTQPLLGPRDVEAALRAARLDLRQAAGDPDRVAAEAAFAAAFAASPYGRSVLGSERALATITVEQVRAFWDRHAGAVATTLVVVGDFDRATIRDRVNAAFGSWRAGQAPAARPPAPAASSSANAPRIAISTADVARPLLAVAFRTPGLRDADVPALELLAAVLGPARGGRLDGALASSRALATAPRVYLFSSRDGGLLVATASLGPGRVHEAARVLVDEALRLSREPVSPEDLTRARTLVEGGGAARRSGLDGTAHRLGLFASVAGDAGFEDTYLARLRKADADALKDVAARTLQLSNLTIAVVLPASGQPGRDDRVSALATRLRAVVTAAAEAPLVPSGRGPVSISGGDVAEYALPSGVRLLVLPDDTAPEVSVRALWSGGVRLEEGRLAGATALLARLLPRGSKTRGEDQLATDLAAIAGRLDGIAAMDSLGLRGDFLASHWERGIDLMVDCLRNPRLGDDEIERERRVVLQAIRARDDDAGELAQRLFQETLFGQHPYRRDLLGTSDSLAGLDRRRLLDYYRRVYLPFDLTFAVVGPVAPDRVAAKLQSLFADVVAPPRAPATTTTAATTSTAATAATVTTARTTMSPQTASGASPASDDAGAAGAGEPTEVFQLIQKAEARLVLGYPGVTVRDPDRFALEVLAEILGGAGGRLTTSLVGRGLAEGVTASSRAGVDPGCFAVNASARPDDLDALVPALRAELARVTRDGVTPDEVVRARRMLIGTRSLALEQRGAVALELALRAALGGAGGPRRHGIDELAAVSAADVARVARRILDPRREVLAVVRPRAGERPATSSNNGCCSEYAAR